MCCKAFVLLLFGFNCGLVNGVVTDYLDVVCNVSVSVLTSRKLESATALYYKPNVACYYHVTVPTGKTVLLINRYFRLEAEVKNACVDFVNIHDGATTSAATLNPSPLCDEMASSNYTSTGSDLTIYFQTDSTGAWRGFDFMFVAITTGTCSSGQFACSTSVCIDKALQCNVYDECGDSSDEAGCTYATAPGLSTDDNAALIGGLVIGLFLLLVIGGAIGYMCWRNHRWRLFMKRPIKAREVVMDETTFASTYPVTKVYYQEKYQSKFRSPGVNIPAAYTSQTQRVTAVTSSSATNEAFVPE